MFGNNTAAIFFQYLTQLGIHKNEEIFAPKYCIFLYYSKKVCISDQISLAYAYIDIYIPVAITSC